MVDRNGRDDTKKRRAAAEGTIVSLHFSPVLIAKRSDAEDVRLDPERLSVAIGRICDAESAEILRSDLSPSHVHLLLRIPPKHSVRSVLPRLRQALTYRLLKQYRRHPEDYWTLHFWQWDHAAWGKSDLDEVEVTHLEEAVAAPSVPTMWTSPFSRTGPSRHPGSREKTAGSPTASTGGGERPAERSGDAPPDRPLKG